MCLEPIVHFAMGKCNHKSVCHKCALRIRLLLEETKCSICKQELDEIVISNDATLTWDEFNPKDAIQDKEDETVYYEDTRAKAAGMQLRSL